MAIEAEVNPDMLKWARESVGMSLERAASRVNTDRDRISQWETGKARPTIRQARMLAETYGRPLAVFYLEHPPKDFSVIKQFRTIAESFGEDLSPDVQLLIRKLAERQQWAREYLRANGARRLGFIGKYTLNDSPQDIASQVRRFILRRDTDTYVDPGKRLAMWTSAIESVGIFVVQGSGRGRITVDDARGFAMVDDVAPFVFVNSKDSQTGRLFTLIHELGHLLLGESAIAIGLVPDEGSRAIRIEQFCDRFASHVLIPEDRLRLESNSFDPSGDVVAQVAEMARRLGASPLAVAARLRQSKRISKDHYTSVAEYTRESLRKKAESSASGGNYYTAEPIRVGKRFLMLAVDAYDRRRILGSQLSTLTGIKLNNIERVMSSIGKAS